VCKKDVQKLLGKINYLRHFISNLVAFEKIKEYLVSPPMLRAPKVGNPFKMYIAMQERVIGVVLLQEEDGKEFLVAYVSRHLLDAKTRYVFLEKL
jgi:hypothetical protein